MVGWSLIGFAQIKLVPPYSTEQSNNQFAER